MDLSADAAGGEVRLQPVALARCARRTGATLAPPTPDARADQVADPAQLPAVPVGEADAPEVPLRQPGEPHPQEGGGKLVQARIDSEVLVVGALLGPIVAQEANPVGQRGVACVTAPGIREGAQVLAG